MVENEVLPKQTETKEDAVEKKKEDEDGADAAENAPPAEDTDGKSDDDVPTELESQIIRQIEYYFGDANLLRDKFLRQQIQDNEDGWVPLDVLLTFKRLAALTTDKKAIINAITKSDAGLVEVSDDHEKLRRSPEHPVPEQNEAYRKEWTTRTAYAKGFPLEAEMSELINFFSAYDKVTNIAMRKFLHKPTKTHKFKGSVFVTFATIEQAKDFVEKEDIQYNGRSLVRKMQNDYLDEKRAEIQKKKSQKEQKHEEELESLKLPKGAVVEFEGADEDLSREVIRSAILKLIGEDFQVAFIDFNRGDKTGRVRFDKDDTAKLFLAKLEDNKLTLPEGKELVMHVLEGDAEAAFLNKAREDMKNRRRAARSGRKRRIGGNHKDSKRARNDD